MEFITCCSITPGWKSKRLHSRLTCLFCLDLPGLISEFSASSLRSIREFSANSPVIRSEFTTLGKRQNLTSFWKLVQGIDLLAYRAPRQGKLSQRAFNARPTI